ncbi:hypothetical protein KFK09_004334 [Dendrobium nobile]|uniref:Uncharacterized protein n=1 Tax=Dendrobium nobile TaxID=94219 RepID=A0A8T3C2L2_DENNO|nr:hypothetical protein KFK09_004334 [Dendrobium nobile]
MSAPFGADLPNHGGDARARMDEGAPADQEGEQEAADAAAMQLVSSNPNQLTLLFQGEEDGNRFKEVERFGPSFFLPRANRAEGFRKSSEREDFRNPGFTTKRWNFPSTEALIFREIWFCILGRLAGFRLKSAYQTTPLGAMSGVARANLDDKSREVGDLGCKMTKALVVEGCEQWRETQGKRVWERQEGKKIEGKV